jgi:carboxyl-terminal processing protease
MIPILKKYIIPIIASALLFLGASFKTTFEIAKQIEIFTTSSKN